MITKPQLALKDNTYKIEVSFVFPPYEAGIRYADGTSAAYITSLDELGNVVVTKKYPSLPTVVNDPIFTSDGQLVELVPENLPMDNVSVVDNVWKLQGDEELISFINLDDFILNFENYKDKQTDITLGTPYTVTYNGHAFQDFIFVPDQDLTSNSYQLISETEIELR